MKLLIIFIFTLLSTLLSANELHSFAHTSQDGNLLVSFELDETVKISHFALENPFRIVLEMQDVVKDQKIKELEEFKNSALKQIIVVPYKRNGVSNLKILIHLEKKTDYEVDVFGNRVLLNIKNIGDSEQLVAKKNDSEKNLKTTNNLVEKQDNKNSKETEKIVSKQENKIDTTKKIETPEVLEPENRLSKIEYQYQGNDLLVALQSNEERDIKSFHLMNPFRVVVDIPDTLKESSILNEIIYNDTFLEKAALSTYKRNGKSGTKVIFTFKDEKPFQAESIGATYVITIKNARETLVAKNQNISDTQTPSKKIDKSETTIANSNNSKTKIETKSLNIEKNDDKTTVVQNNEKKESNLTQTTNNIIEQNKTVATKLEKIDYQYQGEDLLIALQADEEKEIKHFYLVDPFRVVIEFQNTIKDNSIPNEIKYEDSYLEKLVTSSFKKNGLTGIKLIFYFKEVKPFQVEQMGTTTLLTLKGVKTETIVAKKDNTQNSKVLENNNKNITKEIKGNLLSKIDYQYQDEDLLIALQMNEEREVKHFHLIDPFRLVVDIPDTQKDDSILNEIKYNDSYFEKTMVSTYRRNGKNGVKLIFYFREERPFSVENIGNRAIITIKGAKPRVFIAQKENIKNDNNLNVETEKKLAKNSKNDKKNQKIAKVDEKVEQYSNNLESIQFDHSGDDLILMLQIKDQTKFKHFHLTDPFRVFVELEGVVVGNNFFKNITDEFIEDVSLTPFKKNGINGLKVMFHFKENKPYEIDTIGNRVLLTVKNIPRKDLLVSKNSNLKEIQNKNNSKNSKSGNVLESIKYEYTKDTIIFAIKCTEECKGDSFHLTSPFRVFLNIPNISISSTIPEEIAYNDPFIEKVTVTPYNRNGVKGSRVVFHFKQEKSYLVESIGTNTLLSLFGTSGEAVTLKKDIEVFDVNNSNENENSVQTAINNASEKTENKVVSLNNSSEKTDKSELTEVKNKSNESPNYVSVSTQEQKNQLASKDLHSNSQKKYYTISTSTYRNNNSTVSIARNENSVFSSEKISRNLGEAPKLDNIESKNSASKSAIYLKSGFRKYEDSSRVTISTQNNPKIETHLDKKLLKITLKNTSFSPKASRFPLNTSYFDSNVLRVVSIQNGDDLVVQIHLKDSLEPEIVQGDGVIYIDFKE